jgi:hypothetical protein
MKKIFLLLLIAISFHGFAQKIRLTDGSVDVLKGKSALNFDFSYDGVRVGKFADENDYISKKKTEYDKKEPGKGDEWAKSWVGDRKGRYEPRFIESFGDGGFVAKADAEYTLIFTTTFIEPGFNIGITRRPAYIDGYAVLVATSDKGKVLAKFTVDNGP